MKMSAQRVFFWAPRVLGILFAISLSMFALDVFAEGQGFWPTIGTLLLHLVPTFIVVIALAIAWRREWLGAILFGGLAVFYVAWTGGRFPLATYLSISGLLALVGILFLFNWIYGARLRTK